MDSESGSEHDASELFSDSLDEDTEDDDRTWESPDPDVEEMEETDASSSSTSFLPPRTCWRCGHIHHHRHIIPRKLLAFFPELKINDPGSFMELRHLCVMLEKILEVLHGAANKKLGSFSTMYAKRKFLEKILLVKANSKLEAKGALVRVLPTTVPDLVVDRILHFMIKSDDGSPGNYTFEKHEDEISHDLLNTMYWKLADIYDKMKKLEEINFKCEECEEIVSILLKFTLEDFSAWMTTAQEEEEEVDTSSSSHTITMKYKDEDGEDSTTHETLENGVFDCDEEEMLEANADHLD